jgi:PPP family 3-phenylpropionic acid transporter
LRLSALQAASFAWIGVSMPFMPVWLQAQGLNEREIGFTLALGMVMRMLFSQPVAALGDGRFGAARVLLVLYGVSALVYLALPSATSPGAVIAMMAVVGMLSAGMVPLADHITTAAIRAQPALDFGRLRLWGSLSFLMLNIIGGYVLTMFGPGGIPPALAVLCALAAGLVLVAPRPGEAAPPGAMNAAGGAALGPAPDAARLLWLVLMGSALINASHGVLYGFGSLHWRSLGIDDASIGYLWAISVVAEIVFFWAVGRHAARGPAMALGYLAVAGLVAVLRFALMPLATSFAAMVALQLLHAFSFGAQLMGVMALVVALSPEGRRAAIQGRMASLNALAMGGSTILAGFAYQRWEGWSFLTMIPLAAAGLAVLGAAALSVRRLKAQEPAPAPRSPQPDIARG